MHRSRLGNIVIDCHTDDLVAEARFWSTALGYPMPLEPQAEGAFIQLQTPPGEVRVIIQRVCHPPRVHLDIETDCLEREVARMEGLGAQMVARHAEWVVMQAPGGHRFCVGNLYRGGFEQAANRWE